MNKFVLRSIFVMMVLGLITMVGCPTEDSGNNEVVDPSGGKTVDSKYWGTYTTNDGTKIILSEKKYVFITVYENSKSEYQAWTDGAKLYVCVTYLNEKEIQHLGTFTNDTSFTRTYDSTVYTKTSSEVSVAPEFRRAPAFTFLKATILENSEI